MSEESGAVSRRFSSGPGGGHQVAVYEMNQKRERASGERDDPVLWGIATEQAGVVYAPVREYRYGGGRRGAAGPGAEEEGGGEGAKGCTWGVQASGGGGKCM